MKNIAIIPARSGSKGLKDKNIRLLNGKPLLAYTIEAALKSKCYDTVMVSTDSKKYAKIAKEYGAEVPFLRGDENSKDNASPWEVVKEVLLKYKELGLKDKIPSMSEDEVFDLLSTDGMLVKRPLLVGKDFVLTGFREDEWENRLKK